MSCVSALVSLPTLSCLLRPPSPSTCSFPHKTEGLRSVLGKWSESSELSHAASATPTNTKREQNTIFSGRNGSDTKTTKCAGVRVPVARLGRGVAV